jgi:iron-sulfur cluster insertion protein
MDIKVTKSAAKRIAELISTNNKKMVALRVSVDGGGCSGFMYQYKLIDSTNEDDFILNSDGIKIAIDPLSQQFLQGCTVEFIEELGNSYFQISNPNASAKCGCGNSFSF